MKFRNIVLALAVCLGLTFTAHAQTFTYALGTSSCSPGGNISCAGIPLSLAGQLPANVWLNENLTYGTNWLLFGEDLAHLGTAQIDTDASYHPTYGTVTYGTHTATKMTSLSMTYYGYDASGNAYQGAMTISFDWYYVSTCSGRGCGGTLGWHRKVTGGSTTFTITQGY